MADDLAFFSWTVPESGYTWVREKSPGAEGEPEKDYLTSRIPLGEGYSSRRYNPLAETGLFRNFSDLDTSPDAIRKFANKYGALGDDAFVPISARPGSTPGSVLMGLGESLSTWRNAIQSLREMVSLWGAVKENSSALSERIRWDGSRGVRYEGPRVPGLPPPLDQTISYIAMEHDAELLAQFRLGDLAGPAMHYIQRKINEKLTEHNVTSRLLWDSRHARLGLHIVPRTLIGCMWLQFARAIDGNRAYRRCQDCRKWFEVTPHVTRTDRIFCSPTCKASAHRGKMAEARRLFAQGASPREIAKQLVSTTDKVKGWVQR